MRAALATQALEATVVSHASNIRYLTGFAGSSGLLVCTSADAWLVVDGRYEAFVREALQAGELGPVQAERVNRRYDLTLAEVLGRTGAKRVGFEAAHVTVSTLEQWRQAFPGVAWQPTDGLVERQRLIKDEVEQAALRQAAQLLSDVARALGSWVAAGRSERVIAADIDRALVLAGFSGPAFPTIVASGPNSAFPHAQPTERELAAGDLVVLDFGGVLGGYCVDLTRVAAIGQVAREAESLHAAVRDAQAAAFAAVRAGVAAADVDAAARRSLDSRGLAGAFVHGTGHGLGLEVHEAPRIGRADAGSVETLETGMVCTIEPGAYIPGLGGVRLEDDVLVTASGCEVLTDASRDLLIV